MKQRLRGRKRKRPTREEFERLYYDSAITIYELAEHFGVAPQTIYQWAYQFNKKERGQELKHTNLQASWEIEDVSYIDEEIQKEIEENKKIE